MRNQFQSTQQPSYAGYGGRQDTSPSFLSNSILSPAPYSTPPTYTQATPPTLPTPIPAAGPLPTYMPPPANTPTPFTSYYSALPNYAYDTVSNLDQYKSQPVPQRTSSGPSQAIVGRSSQMRGTPNVVRRAKGGITDLMDDVE